MNFSRMSMPLLSLVCSMIAIVAAQTKPSCNSTCGDLNIRYPFGTSEGCYHNNDEMFKINCYSLPDGTLVANHSTVNFRVLNISLDGELRLSAGVVFQCGDESDDPSTFELGRFNISTSRNELILVGCNTFGFIYDQEGVTFNGCLAYCEIISDVTNGSCSGSGCCRSPIYTGFSSYNLALGSIDKRSVSQFNPCNYGFIAEDGAYNFSSLDLKDLRNKKEFPMVLNWTIANESCDEAKKNTSAYACKENSICLGFQSGYRCSCKDGFQGNPYLSGGCQDVDECSSTIKPCTNGTCINLVGGYNCSCPPGYKGDGKKDGSGCVLEPKSKNDSIVHIALGISVGLLILTILMFFLCWIHKERTIRQLREKFFEQNGGSLLQELLSKQQKQYCDGDDASNGTESYH